MSDFTSVPEDMVPLFAEAREKGLWFFVNYQQMWFSPDELEKHQLNGLFRWGAVNWKLRHPDEMVEGLRKIERAAREDVIRAEQRVAASKAKVKVKESS